MLALGWCVLTAAASLAGGCNHEGSAPASQLGPRLAIVEHLLSDRYEGASDPSTAAIPSAVVAGERRPVLSSSPRVSLLIGSVPTNGGRDATLTVEVPDEFRGKTLRLAAAVSTGAAIVQQEPLVVDGASAEIPLRLSFAEPIAPQTYVQVTGREAPPEQSYTTKPIAIPSRSPRLRFGIALDETEWPAGNPAVNFQLVALDEHGEKTLFEETIDPARKPEQRGWLDREVDLAPLAGRTTRLRFVTALVGDPLPGRFLFPVWSDPVIVSPDPAGAPRRNVLLISLDTLRADHLGCYGYRRPTSPRIDALARESTLFERAYAQFPGTAGSHMTLLSSFYACVHQVTGSIGAHRKLRPDIHPLAELLRAQGYATAAYTEDGWVTADTGYDRGFTTFVESKSPVVTQPTGQADVTFPSALRWIEQHPDTPWFVFVHTYQVHHPYTPPEGYLERVAPDHGEDRASRDAALYDGEIRYTDDLLGAMLDGLRRAGALDSTILILISDHGEQFGEHKLFAHGNSLFDILLHVPLIVRAPGLVPAGKRISAEVGLIDVPPTVLELLGLPPLPAAQGRSLVPLLKGESLPDRTLWAELPPRLISARTGDTKWVIGQKAARFQVYDLANDPAETRDVSGRYPPDSGKKLLDEFQGICAILPPAPPPEREEVIDPAVREKLKALGYTD